MLKVDLLCSIYQHCALHFQGLEADGSICHSFRCEERGSDSRDMRVKIQGISDICRNTANMEGSSRSLEVSCGYKDSDSDVTVL